MYSSRSVQNVWFVTFAHLLFSVGRSTIFVASLVFMKGTSCFVIRRNFSRVGMLNRAMANFKRS